MSTQLPKSLIDTTVIGDWLVISMKIKQLGNKGGKVAEIDQQIKQVWEKYGKAKPAFQLLEKIRSSKASYNNFLMCDFSSAEIFKILSREYIFKKMDRYKYR